MTVTDTSPMDDPQVISMLDNLRNLSVQIKEIDNELGSDSGGVVAQRNRMAGEFVERFSADEGFKTFADRVIDHVVKSTNAGENKELLTAIYTSLIDRLQKDYGKPVREFLDAEIAKLPKTETPEVSDARKAELAEKRTKLVGIFKAQKEMLKFYDVTTLPSDIDEPPIRRGSIGPRGASFTKSYQFYMDGKLQQLTDSDGNKTDASLSNIATSKLKKPLGWSTKNLRDFIIEQLGASVNEKTNEVDLPSVWEVTLPQPVNAVLKGVESTEASVDESDDDDDNNTTAAVATDDAFAGA